MLALTYLSESWNERSITSAVYELWALPTLIALVVLPSDASAWAKYAVLTVLLSAPSRKNRP